MSLVQMHLCFFEAKFARLEYIKDNRFNMAFMRYTGEWVEVYPNLSLEQCLTAVENDSFFSSVIIKQR